MNTDKKLRSWAERKAQQGAATDAGGVCEDIPEFHSAARREMLTGLHEDS